jgi:acetylornithine deacetylase/succinyl-diaminopimelate desuccinylase-like protein
VIETELLAALDAVLPATRADLEELVRIPSVSADPARAGDVARAAELVAAHARDAGAAQVDVVSAGGAPAVLATWPAPGGAPTVLLYAHLDVQPTGPVDQWTGDPFEPVERDGRLYARGAADDKAGVAMHLAVLRAFGGRPPVGVVLFVEGEEEVGSPTLVRLLEKHRERLRSDVIVIADSGNAAVDVPTFTTSLRGLVDAVVEVRALERPVHSGIYGGAAPDALTALCRLLATLHDDAGDVAVEGLHHGSSDAPDVPEEQFRSDAGVLPGVGLLGTGTVPERTWHRPAATVLALEAPGVDEAANVLLPRARAVVSVRLAPGDDGRRAMQRLTAHLQEHAPWGVQVDVVPGAVGEPFALGAVGPVYDVARQAFGEAYGNAAVEGGIGGSIPFIAEFARAFPGATVLVTGVGDPASRWHGIDESLHLGMWATACRAEALLLARLA